jgi:DNA-binding GntR family transcriptional regulator
MKSVLFQGDSSGDQMLRGHPTGQGPGAGFPGGTPFLDRITAASEAGKHTLASRLVERLHGAILAGELKPGAKINLEQVRRNFAVSLSPLREALARLTATRLVELSDNRGYTVTNVSRANLEEITRTRIEIECSALRLAIANGDLDWESEVTRALHRLHRSVRDPARPETVEAWEEAHREFHLALVAGANAPLLADFCLVLHNLNDRYRRIFHLEQQDARNCFVEHSEIAESAIARDSDLCCRKLRAHIERTGADLRTILTDRLIP